MKQSMDQWIESVRGEGPLVLLESQSNNHPAGRYSFLAYQPKATIKAYGSHIECTENGTTSIYDENPWQALSQFRERYPDYMFGYLGYDLKNYIEPLQSRNDDSIEAPDLFFMIPEVVLKFDHQFQTTEVLRGQMPHITTDSQENKHVFFNHIQSSLHEDRYHATVERIKQHITQGKYYELNFTHQLRADYNGRPYDLYKKMRQAGPVPFGAYVSFDDISVCCQSPERFLRKEGRQVMSQPIKGTIKRGTTEKEDVSLKKKLFVSAKDRAENMMIVDLVRNDLGRIAQVDSVEVSDLFEIQSFPTVHQMVSTIRAVVNTQDPIEIIKACFPMGSMTGAPKVQTMRRIEALENYRRGIYSGAIGYFTPQGDFDFNVVIRTAIVKDKELFYSVGGAITADSNPEGEWNESWLKAEALQQCMLNGEYR